VREERILTPAEADPVRQGDYLYLLAPPERAQALDRFFVDTPAPDPHLLGDFFVSGDVTLGALAEIYGLSVGPEAAAPLADYLKARLGRPPKSGDTVPLGPIVLVVRRLDGERVTEVGLRLPEEEEQPQGFLARMKRLARRLHPFQER
jgi:cell volume regulation protein A